jgi:hypothetical protein
MSVCGFYVIVVAADAGEFVAMYESLSKYPESSYADAVT